MKWLAVLAVVIVLGIVALFMHGEPEPSRQSTSPPAAPVTQALPAPAPRSVSVIASVQPWQRIELRGVLLRGKDSAASQALLSIDSQPVQVFHGGEQVLAGWTLRSIEADHVTVGNSTEQHKLYVLPPRQTPPAEVAAGSGKAARETPLAGFVPSAPPAGFVPPPPSVETNRRFVQDRQNRQSGGVR